MDNSKLFLDAWGGGDDSKAEPLAGRVDPDTRAEYFQAAFAGKRAGMPKARQVDYRLNTTKAARLNTGELFQLQDYLDSATPWNQLPAWVRDGGYFVADASTKKRETTLENETGYNTTERQEIFNAFNAQIGALAEMASKESLRGSVFLDTELKSAFERFGEAQVMDALMAEHPQAAEYTVGHLKALKAEAAQAEAMLKKDAEQADVAAEIRAAQEAIEAMNTVQEAE